jgi:isoamylase
MRQRSQDFARKVRGTDYPVTRIQVVVCHTSREMRYHIRNLGAQQLQKDTGVTDGHEGIPQAASVQQKVDLASILSRDSSGQPILDPPVLWDIESDPVLAGAKMIAEAWDAAGLYQVGSFSGDNWREWNGRFRDDVRGFFRGDAGSVSQIADRLLGSPQIYGHKEREAEVSVNFVTCHDGLTLNDLVSYNVKRNEANGESNRDGADDNRSWNCGVEGLTDDAGVDALRNRQVKNLLTCAMLSLGMPMIGMGDEVRRTQHGNNSAYCQDSWFDWSLISKHADVHRFVQLLIHRRLCRFLS